MNHRHPWVLLISTHSPCTPRLSFRGFHPNAEPLPGRACHGKRNSARSLDLFNLKYIKVFNFTCKTSHILLLFTIKLPFNVLRLTWNTLNLIKVNSLWNCGFEGCHLSLVLAGPLHMYRCAQAKGGSEAFSPFLTLDTWSGNRPPRSKGFVSRNSCNKVKN